MKALYQALSAQIKGAGIKWIDFDSGQLESDESRKPLAFPAALFTFAFSPSNISEASEQRENATITVRLAFDVTASRTSADTPESIMERSLAWVAQADASYAALQGFEPSDFEAMECTGRGQEQRSDGLVVWRMTFNTARWLFED